MPHHSSHVLFGILCVLFLSLPQIVTQSQSNDCNSGVLQRLQVGGQGQVIPGQTRNRMRTVPGGDQVGFVEVGEVFTVLDGPQCNGNISWWQVTTPSGITGWTAEGVDGEAFLEPIVNPTESGGGGASVADTQQITPYYQLNVSIYEALLRAPANVSIIESVRNANEVCEEFSRLKIGQQVKLVRDPLSANFYYGHPLLEGHMYSTRPLMRLVAYIQQSLNIDLVADFGGFLVTFYRYGGQLQEGPYCFNGKYVWRIGNYWIAENNETGENIAVTDKIPALPSFDYSVHMLDLQSGAPILSSMEQIAFGLGGGGDSFYLPPLWQIDGCEPFETVSYRSEQCLTMYPFNGDLEVVVQLFQPDGVLYKELELMPEATNIRRLDNWIDYAGVFSSIPTNSIDVWLPDELGLPAGTWTVVAKQQDRIITQSYVLKRPTEPKLYPLCDGARVEYWLGNVPAHKRFDAVLYELTDITFDGLEEWIDYSASYTEVGRWPVTASQSGHTLIQSSIQLAHPGVLAVVESGEEVRSFDVWDDTSFQEAYPLQCLYSATSAQPALIEYNRLYHNSFSFDDDGQKVNLHHYTFWGQQGDSLNIRMVASPTQYSVSAELETIDSQLWLLSSDGNLLAEDNNGAGRPFRSTDALIHDVILPEDGFYTLVAEDISDMDTESTYTLLIESDVIENRLSPGNISSANLVSESDQWQFYGEADDVFTIKAISEDFDIQLSLRDDTGVELSQDDDNGSYLNAEISNFNVPNTGIYTINVTSWNKKTGSYTLEITNE